MTHSKHSSQNERYNLVQSFLHAKENVISILGNHNYLKWGFSAFDSLYNGRRNHQHHVSRLVANATVDNNFKKIEVFVWFYINIF
jgi:hypothetical protein